MESRTTPRIVGRKNMVMSPTGLGTNKDCAGEYHQQFTLPAKYVPEHLG
jgi:hypothetical protein